MISKITRWLVLAALPWIFTACTVAPPRAPGELGREFIATVPGTWMGEVSSRTMSCRMIKQFNVDGTARGVLMIKRKAGGLHVVMPEIPFTSRWRVKGDVVEAYEVKTGVPGFFQKGEVIRDTILSVSRNRIVSRSIDSGELQVITRLSSSR